MPQQLEAVLDILKQHSIESREFSGARVEVLHAPVDPLAFSRRFVAANRPCLIRGAIAHWPAMHRWSQEYFTAQAGSTVVSAQLTPNGLGDAVTAHTTADGVEGQCFCLPHTERMPFADFHTLFFQGAQGAGGSSSCVDGAARVPYLQQQNSNLTAELPQLLPDVDAALEWGTAAFGAPPEAVNLWVGDERAATTFHKDHYENLYAVVRGTKIFHLLPPTEVYRMGLQRYPAAQYEPQEDGRLAPVLLQPPSTVLWCPVHPQPEDAEAARAAHPLFFDDRLPAPLRVEVEAGDVLYLPATWWHYVQQRPCPEQRWCVAVNFWHDMAFTDRHATLNLVVSLARQLGLVPGEEGE